MVNLPWVKNFLYSFIRVGRRVNGEKKASATAGYRSLVNQPVATNFTVWAIPTQIGILLSEQDYCI
jgi:hypothetical protein